MYNIRSIGISILSFTGFCKNDKDHDLHMLVVTYEVDPDTAKSRRIGEGKMPIYPRTDTFVDIDADYGEPIYQISGNNHPDSSI